MIHLKQCTCENSWLNPNEGITVSSLDTFSLIYSIERNFLQQRVRCYAWSMVVTWWCGQKIQYIIQVRFDKVLSCKIQELSAHISQ